MAAALQIDAAASLDSDGGFAPYAPRDWYWIVRGNETRRWSSAARGYVPADDPAYLAFVDRKGLPSTIASEAELWDVLRDQAPDRLPDNQRYVSVATVRERLEAVDLWGAMVDGLIGAGGYALLAKVMTLRLGILATDPQARGLLAQIGADPEIVLGPE